jgi:hypothetical protein
LSNAHSPETRASVARILSVFAAGARPLRRALRRESTRKPLVFLLFALGAAAWV